jgi:hypothetical protein
MSTKISQLTASSTLLKSTDLLEVSVYNGSTYDSKKMNGSQILGERYIGESFGGGVVFNLWRGADGIQHGLIVGLTDLSASKAWSNIVASLIGAGAQSTWDGLSNSNAIVGQALHTDSAAKLCLDSTADGQTDWYLPSVDEMLKLRVNRFEVAQGLELASGTNLASTYWTSTEFNSTNAYLIDFSTLDINSNTKGLGYKVRAIRKF